MWSLAFTAQIDADDNYYYAFRTEYEFKKGDKYEMTQYSITNWKTPNPTTADKLNKSLVFKAVLLYFMDAQRDLQADTKLRTSYFGKLAAQLDDDYNEETLTKIKTLIQQLNDTAVEESEALKHLRYELTQLNKTTQTRGEGVSISAIPNKTRDLHKNMKVNFQDESSDVFSMEYHGMGTRSWASILSFSAFVSWEVKRKKKDSEAFFPILALEEPEAHLHPNAQRTLYKQINGILGQKIVSTHSPYIAGQANLKELRHFYKKEDAVEINQILSAEEEEKRIGELLKEIDDERGSEAINKKNRPIIEQLLREKHQKLDSSEIKKIRREVLNTRGEILFAKAMILFEGETEEQALPLLAQEYFGCSPFELGLNFIGVGGSNYKPFLNLAKMLNLPCYILSDGESDIVEGVKSQVNKVFGDEEFPLFILDEGSNFEKYLIDNGYQGELISAINTIEGDNYFPRDYINEFNGQEKKGGGIRNYKDENGITSEVQKTEALYDCLSGGKTEYAEEIAKVIINKKDENENCIMPPKIKALFDKLHLDLNL